MKYKFLLLILTTLVGSINLMAACSISAQEIGKEESSFLMGKLAGGAKMLRDLPPVKEIFFSLRDPESNLVGGISGYSIYGGSFIDMLWVDESYRKQGYGKQLIESFEIEVRQQGCHFVNVTSMDFWKAIPFYEKLGYKIEFVREGYAKDSKMYSLLKSLN